MQDSTGRIRIDVDDDRYLVGKKARVTGELDRDDHHTKISVDNVYILK